MLDVLIVGGMVADGTGGPLVRWDVGVLHGRDCATYLQPRVQVQGVVHVLVNGEVAVQNGKLTGVRSGRVLRRK